MKLFEKADEFWDNHIKNTVSVKDDYAESMLSYVENIKEEVHHETKPLYSECVSLMISPATMDDVMNDTNENADENIILYADNEIYGDQEQNLNDVYSCKHCHTNFYDM